MKTAVAGYPRIGTLRELKFASEKYFRKETGAEELLKEQFKTHIVTLGTAKEHPWLPKMYESFGFTAYDKVHFRGKQHTTILFKKELN